ncbi:30S ribosomal protein S4 [archaeon]|jgi:small subunit ribosomal protein S4|nr:30S ribosomal protein S4 [archaeon]MBT4242052.1 30S ribosomal protein S4 [archaeon]MBT4417740.1 30S ribosomal protein S4 [archaeon]
MLRKRKKYSRPRKPFDKPRIEEENVLRERYGLKNKKEIWKADAAIGRLRNLAKELITASEEEKQAFVDRLNKKGFNVENIAGVLSLDKEDWLKRRLQTIVFANGLTSTPKQARQLIAHKHVSVGSQVVNIPSYMVSLEEEPDIKLKITLKVQTPKKSKAEEIIEDIVEDGEGSSESEDSEGVKNVEDLKNVEDSEVMASEEGVSEQGSEDSNIADESVNAEEKKEEPSEDKPKEDKK